MRSERGAALLLVIVLSTIALVIMTTVLYMVTSGTWLSGSEKRYRTACEAALGGVDVIRSVIQAQAPTAVPGVAMTFQPSFNNKLIAGSMAGFDTSITIDPAKPATYDISIDLGNPIYRVYVKMVQKIQGNTQKGYKEVRTKTGVEPSDPGMGQVLYTYYTFEVLSQLATNPTERCRLDLVHIY